MTQTHTTPAIPLSQYIEQLAGPTATTAFSPLTGCGWLLVDLHNGKEADIPSQMSLPQCPVIALGESPEDRSDGHFDLYLPDLATFDDLLPVLNQHTTAATMLVALLRQNADFDIYSGLQAESLTYGNLLSSSDFNSWLSTHGNSKPLLTTEQADDIAAVLVERDQNCLQITFNRPQVHNAFNALTRQALCEALELAHLDATIERVVLAGAGRSFCAGGDLSEFGRVQDPATAHLSRVLGSAGYLLGTLPCESTARVQGACIGAGIELPAFMNRIEAREDAFFALPEVSMGLVPGAGGTFSVTRRIGRQRAAWMALSGQRIDAHQALLWGLVDALI